jgi:hypothetical protein
VEVQLHAFLLPALEGGEWSASRPGRCVPGERTPSNHWIGVWVGTRAGLDAMMKRKILSPRRKSNPQISIVQPAASALDGGEWSALRPGRFTPR